MRHLKPYKVFESRSNQIVSEIKDMSRDLEDDGYNISMVSNMGKLMISINKRSGGRIIRIKYKDIGWFINRVEDFLNSEGYNSCLEFEGGWNIDKKNTRPKYLKVARISTSVDYYPDDNLELNEGLIPVSIMDEAMDMLDELKDEGYDIDISDGRYYDSYIFITKGHPENRVEINYLDIKKCCDRVSDYLKSEGFKVKILHGDLMSVRNLFYHPVENDTKSHVFKINIAKG